MKKTTLTTVAIAVVVAASGGYFVGKTVPATGDDCAIHRT